MKQGETGMMIYVNIQRISQRKPAMQPVPLVLSGTPRTVAELITRCVEACVEQQHRRITAPGDNVLSQEQMDDLATVGKSAFGVDGNGIPTDKSEAIANALQSYQDGIYRIFLNGESLQDLEDPISLSDRDVLTFVRLTMLSGGGW